MLPLYIFKWNTSINCNVNKFWIERYYVNISLQKSVWRILIAVQESTTNTATRYYETVTSRTTVKELLRPLIFRGWCTFRRTRSKISHHVSKKIQNTFFLHQVTTLTWWNRLIRTARSVDKEVILVFSILDTINIGFLKIDEKRYEMSAITGTDGSVYASELPKFMQQRYKQQYSVS